MIGGKSNWVLVLPFINLVGGFKFPKAPRGDIFGEIHSRKRLEILVPGIMMDILQQVSSGCLPS